MRTFRLVAALGTVGVATVAALTATPGTGVAAAAGPQNARLCTAVTPGEAACDAVVRRNTTASTTTPVGYGPADLQSAYALPSATAGGGQVVAVVDAYDDPTAEADLGVYRSHYRLPACTTANGCLRKADQSGGTSLPKANANWAQETSLDLDVASAVCPNCRLLLVEARSAQLTDLGAAVDAAVRLGATVVSNSYGVGDADDAKYGSHYNHPGVAIVASAGDNGYGVQYPASSRYVTAVGGTTLKRAAGTRGWSETAWNGSGSGCSAYNTAPAGQAAVSTGCAKRAVADVAAVADPATGVAVYDSTPYAKQSGWLEFGGTSAAAPLVAGVYALAGNAATVDNGYPYAHAGALNDVASGSNGSCPTSQWCTARTGWDGPTGLGTPHGTGAF